MTELYSSREEMADADWLDNTDVDEQRDADGQIIATAPNGDVWMLPTSAPQTKETA